MLNMSAVDHVQLTPKSRFRFTCHKGISCFTKCCSNIDIMLTPYDIIALKRRLGITSEEFLERYTYTRTEEKSSFPFLFLRMKDDGARSCHFVTSEGCSIYEDRPANCRYYPIGQGTLKKALDGEIVDEEFFFFVREAHCKGFEELDEWTVERWREDQGVDRYDELNRSWKSIILMRNLPGKELDEKKQELFYMACYDTDRFRRFVFNSKFLDHFEVDETLHEKLSTDDVELMLFGFKFVKYILMMEETLKTKTKE
ncbi:MAG TPA: YkgJ family cysteine cluster protein [Thermodesulfovibrionales bacterium]|jgi:Fe-S-cluster containining protein|nr:YkgJ family cysteine cluster protein [Thermodesulfovibrionales bacterium]